MRPRLIACAVFVLAAAPSAHAQDNAAAGLFTEARQLPLVSQSLTLRVAGGRAELRLVQVFANDGEDLGQADYHLYVPQGASVSGFGFWNRGEFLAAELRVREEAEARHRRAAEQGRATGILRQENRIHSFSVYPLPGGEQKTVETTLQLPVEHEMGRSHVRLPVDSFVGQPAPPSSVLVDVTSEDALADFGTDGGALRELARSERRLYLALSTARAVEIWWSEAGAPLRARAELVPLEEGDLGLHVRLALGDPHALARPYRAVHLLVDGSYSMRRRAAAVRAFLERVRRGASAPVSVHLLAEREARFGPGTAPEAVTAALLSGAVGQRAQWPQFAQALDALGCEQPALRCAVLSDAQLPGLARGHGKRTPLVLLADPHELAWLGEKLPEDASVHQWGVDPEARLLERADECVLPVFTLRGVFQDGQPLALPPRTPVRVAAGGLLRAYVRTSSRTPVTLVGDVDGQERRIELAPAWLTKESEAGAALRRAVYQELLAAWMDAYRRSPEPELQKQIVAVSLREGVPTAFTALQVDDPRLSLSAIKPGDPLVSVPEEPGLRAVVVWYAFGEMRRLRHDPQRHVFLDRFLVPRGWRGGPYAVELFKHYDDGSVKTAELWYDLDERGPLATVALDAAAGLVRIDTGRDTRQVASVQVHLADGRVLALSPVASAWAVPLRELSARFTLVLRDAAGNRTRLPCALHADGVRVELEARASSPPPAETQPAQAESSAGALRLEGDAIVLTLDGRERRVPAGDLRLRSLQLGAWHAQGDDLFFGTAGGDLVRLQCEAGGNCRGRRLGATPAHHAVVGIAPLCAAAEGHSDAASKRGAAATGAPADATRAAATPCSASDRLLIGVLGDGFYEWRAGRLQRRRLGVGTRFVTAVTAFGRAVYVGTANNGLWVLRGGRLSRACFPRRHVAALSVEPGALLITSGFGRYRLAARGCATRLDDGLAALPLGSSRLTAAVEWQGRTYVGSFDRGLFRWTAGGLEPRELGLTPLELQVNALAVFDGSLWIGTEGGLLELAPGTGGVQRVLASAVHGLAPGQRGLAVASSEGLRLVTPERDVRSLGDGQSERLGRGLTAVAFWDGALYAGGLEGLVRVDLDGTSARPVSAAQGFPAHWVTALLPSDDGLIVGTYDQGVHVLRGGGVRPLPGLEAQWVPAGGLSRGPQGELWVGGIGMPAVRWAQGRAVRVALPAEDVYGVLGREHEHLLLTSLGLMRVAGALDERRFDLQVGQAGPGLEEPVGRGRRPERDGHGERRGDGAPGASARRQLAQRATRQ